MQVKPHDNKRRNGHLAVCQNMLMEMADPLVEALRASRAEIEREADSVGMRWHAVHNAAEGAVRVIELAG